MFKKKHKASAAPKRRSDPTKSKAFRSAVSSAVSKSRRKVVDEWGAKMKKVRAKVAAKKQDVVDVAIHDIAIPSVAGAATSLALDVLVNKSTKLKTSPNLARAVKVIGGVALTAGAAMAKPTRRYAPAFTNGPLTVVMSDMGRSALKKQLSGIDDDEAAAQAAAYQAQQQMNALAAPEGMGNIPLDMQVNDQVFAN